MKKLKLDWKENYKNITNERFGQVIWNAMAYSGYWESPEANPLFFISDEELNLIINKYLKNQYGK